MAERSRSVGGNTRREVMTQLLKRGPVSAAEIGKQLGISAAGVRRHLDILEEEGLAETCEANAVAGEEAGRGRPAKYFRLTSAGRDHFGNGYDAMAEQALSALRTIGGGEAVRAFANQWVDGMLGGVEPLAANADPDEVERAVGELVHALEANGYAPTVTRAGGGIQICQHHCPVSAVAAEHPELCEAEHEAISARVGRHVQPLALLSDGHGLCTTNIPLAIGAGREPPATDAALDPTHHEERKRTR